MTKQEVIDYMEASQKMHELMMTRLQNYLFYGDTAEKFIATSKEHCDFGIMLYKDGGDLENIIGSLFYENLESLHTKWHLEYKKVYDTCFKPEDQEKKGFFSKIIKPKAINEMDIDRAKLYFSELQITTKELMRSLGSSRRRINALAESKFN